MSIKPPPSSTQLKILVSALPWFGELDPDRQNALWQWVELLDVHGGSVLFEQGSVSDALYVVLTGSFGAYRVDADGPARLIGRISAGECAGEMGLLSGDPRGASVKALRDSQVLKLARAAFEQFILTTPNALLGIARQAIARAARPSTDGRGMPRTFAVLPQPQSPDARHFAEHLVQALNRYGDVALVTSEAAGWDLQALHDVELKSDFVVFLADATHPEWRARCQRQADLCLHLCDGNGKVHPIDHSDWPKPFDASNHVAVMWHTERARHGCTRQLRATLSALTVHHVQGDDDLPRLVRLLLGKSMNLVLSGGGARGFAHIGVIKALQEADIHIDSIGGTSIGAMIGAAVAIGWSVEEMTEVFRRAFVSTNPLSDYTLPLVSLVSGRKVSRLMHEAFGDREIEDLPKPFFCVSANLTRGEAQVHERGSLWLALRASVSIPGLLPPVGMRGEVLVDGGVVDNLPVGLMRQRQAGEVIAVDIGGDHAVKAHSDEYELPPGWWMQHEWFGKSKRPGLGDVLLRAGMLNASAMTQAARAQSTLLIRPSLQGIGLLEWKAFDRAISIGYQHAVRLLGGESESFATETPPL